MMRKDNPNLVVLPAHVNSGAALCRYEELGRSCIYVKPQARPSDFDAMGAGSSSSTSGAVDIKGENRRAKSPSIDSPAGGDEENQSDDGMVIQEEVDVEDVSSAATTHLDAPLESPWVAIEEKLYMDLSHSTPGAQQMFYKPPNLQNQVQNQLQFHPQLQSDGPHDLSISTRTMDSHSSQNQHLDEYVQPSSFLQSLNKRKFDSLESNTVHDKIIKFRDDPNDAINPHDTSATLFRNEIPNSSSFLDQLTYVHPLNTYVLNTNENLFPPQPHLFPLQPHLFPPQPRQMLDSSLMQSCTPFYLNQISNPFLPPTTTNPFLPPALNFVRGNEPGMFPVSTMPSSQSFQSSVTMESSQMHHMQIPPAESAEHLVSHMSSVESTQNYLPNIGTSAPESFSNISAEERLQSHREIKVEHEIRGITVMESKIYVICSDVTDLVFVYDVLTSEPSQIKVARMRSPVGIVACCVCRCLYITEDISKCVFRVTLANNKVDKFLDVIPSDLCVVHNKQSSGNGCLLLINDSIELYNTDGECVNVTVMESIYSPKLNKNIKQVCADSKGNFIVSNESEKFSMILKLAKDGKTLLKTFGGRCGHGKGQLWKSFKILVDSRLEQILIFDRGNDRLLLVDSELCLIGERQIRFGERQISSDELDQIGYCSDDKKIVIGGHGRLLIFDFAQNDFLQDANKCVSQSESGSEDSKNKEVTNGMDLQLLTSIVLENVEVRGTAILNDKIYVCFVDGKETKFKIYSREQPYNCLYTIEKTEVGNPSCLSACSVNVCLYLTDKNRDNPCVWKMTVNRKLTKWLEYVDPPFTLSVASNGSVIMLSVKEGIRKLNIYDSYGNISRCICLEDTMSGRFHHAVASANGCFYIAAAVLTNDEFFDRYDRELKIYKVSSSGYHMYEENIAVDKLLLAIDQDDNLYFVDSTKCMLLQLDKTLESRKILLNSDVHLIENPVDIRVYNDKTEQLFLMTESANNKETSYVELLSRNRIADDKEQCPTGDKHIDVKEIPDISVFGVTLSKNYIYMDCSEENECDDIHRIYIFSNKKPFKKMGQNEMRDIHCISLALASSIHSDVLFILECCRYFCCVISYACIHTKRILTVQVQKFGDQPREWTRVVGGYPLDISAESTQERLLVTVGDKETATNCFKCYIDAYNMSSQGSQPERIELPKEINRVFKVKELSNGNLVVAYERCDLDDNNESRAHGKKLNYLISQVTWRGQIVCSYPVPSTIEYGFLEFISDDMVAYPGGQGIYVLHYMNNTYKQIVIKNCASALCYVEQKQLLMVGHDDGFSLVTLEEKCLKNIPALPGPNQTQECEISRIPVQQSLIDQPSPEFGVGLLHKGMLRRVKNISSLAWVKNRIVVAVEGKGVLFFSDKVPFCQFKSETIESCDCGLTVVVASNCGQTLFMGCCGCDQDIRKIEYPNARKSTWDDCFEQKWRLLSLSCNADNLVALVKRYDDDDSDDDEEDEDNFKKDPDDFSLVVYNPVAENWRTPNKIELPKNLNKPLEAIENSNGHFIIACEIHRTTLEKRSSKLDDGTRSYDKNCWAYEVSREGKVMRTIACFDNSFDYQICYFWWHSDFEYTRECLLEKDNRIFLLDHTSNKLIVLNSENEVEVMSTYEIEKPTNMCYMRQKQQLFIARKTESDVAISIYNLLWN